MKQILMVLFVMMFVTGCAGDPTEHVLPPDPTTWAEDADTKGAIERLNPDDRELLGRYALRVAVASTLLGDNPVSGFVTIGEAIEDQRKWEADQAEKKRVEEALAAEAAALAERVREEREQRLKSMRDKVTVAVVEKTFRSANYRAGRYSDDITMRVAFENHADADIVGVKGVLHFADFFGDSIQKVTVAYDKPIAAGATATWAAVLDYNQFIKNDVKLAQTDLDKLKITWEPAVIVFADGTSLFADE